MLTNMVKKHVAKQQIQKRKNEAIVAAHSLSNAVVEHLNRSVSQAYINQKRIDIESKRLQSFVLSLTKISEGLIVLIDSFNQVGDVESWADVIDNDLSLILGTLQDVFEGIGTFSNINF